jgi:hypothetical protein
MWLYTTVPARYKKDSLSLHLQLGSSVLISGRKPLAFVLRWLQIRSHAEGLIVPTHGGSEISLDILFFQWAKEQRREASCGGVYFPIFLIS